MKRTIAGICVAAILLAAGAAWAAVPAGRSMRGYLAQRSGDYATAIDNYKAALKDDPDSVGLRLRLVRLYSVFGEMDQALRVLDDGLERRPGNPDLLYTKAKTLLMTNRNAEAAEAASAAAEKGGGAKAYALAVRLLDNADKREKALALAEKWASEFPDDPEAFFQKGGVLEHMDRGEDAEKAYRRAIEIKPTFHPALQALADRLARGGKRDEAIKLYQDVIALNPHEAQVYIALSQLFLEAGRADKARENLAAAENWIKGPPILILRMGLLYMELGDPEAALRVIEGIPEEERDERAWFFLGAARLGQDKFEQAIQAFDRIPATSPIYGEGLIRRSQALREAGHGDQAVSDLRKWLAEHGEDVEATLALAALLQSLDRNKEAVELLETYRAAHEAKDARVFFALGAAYDKTGEWEKSVDNLQKAIEIDPGHAHALNYLGYTFAERGIRLEEAERFVLRAVEILPKNGYIADSLGWVYFKQKRLAEAKEVLERAVKLAGDDPIIWEHLGDVCAAQGDKDRAREAYGKALSIKPDTPGLKAKLDGLGEK